MLIGDSFPEYIVIRTAIIALRLITPLSSLYTLYVLLLPLAKQQWQDTIPLGRLPLPVEIYLFIEVGFLLIVYLPLRLWLQAPAIHPETAGKPGRQTLFEKVLDAASEEYLSKWFLGAETETLQRENIEEFVSWSLMNKHFEKLDADEAEEVSSYADHLESKLKREFPKGRGKAKSLRVTIDDVPMLHRPLFWYLIVFSLDCITSTALHLCSFAQYRASLASTLSVFPPRPLALLFGRSQKPGAKLSYWYREHKSKTRLPIVLIHGIGIGLFPYLSFIVNLTSRLPGVDDNDDGDVGIIILEILPVCSRICPPALSTPEINAQIGKIVDSHGWKDFVLIGHSYGTAVSSGILRDPVLSLRVKATMLVDPICFLLHLPDVAYNFTRRSPRCASEHMLYYFTGRDALVSHTLARRFFWSEYILWKEDFRPDMKLMVILSAKDLIVPKQEIWDYLTNSTDLINAAPSGRKQMKDLVEWKEGNLEVWWFKQFNHAGLFASKGARRGVAEAAKSLTNSSHENGHT